jgi:hypothetical protein
VEQLDDDDDDAASTTSSSSSTDSGSSSDEETFYRDYRANLRSSLLVGQHAARQRAVEDDMARFMRFMRRELDAVDEQVMRPDLYGDATKGLFAIHAHDLSLANIFVDPEDPSKIVSLPISIVPMMWFWA